MNVQFGKNPLQALQQKNQSQQKQQQHKQNLSNPLQPITKDTFGKKDPKFGASCCG